MGFMPLTLVLTRSLIIALSLWIIGGGMAAIISFDRTDDLAHPQLPLVQLIDPELDELDDEGSSHATAVFVWLHATGGDAVTGLFNSFASRSASVSRPLYLTLAQYRI